MHIKLNLETLKFHNFDLTNCDLTKRAKETFSNNAVNNGLFIAIYKPWIACTEDEIRKIM